MPSIPRQLCALISLALLSAPAFAQEQDIEKIRVSGSKLNQSLLEAPQSVTVLDRITLEKAGIANLRQVADLAPNVSISQIGQVGGSFISIRGIESNPFIVNRAAVYIDGIPYRDPDDINVRNAMQIEILRGPQSTLYGANANAGIIVIETRTPQQALTGEVHTSLKFFAGRQAQVLDAYASGAVSDKLSSSVSLNYEKGDSYIKNIGSAVNLPGEIRNLNLTSNHRYFLDQGGQLDLVLLYKDLAAPGLYEQEFPALDYRAYGELYAASLNQGLKPGKFEQVNDAPKRTDEEERGVGSAYSQDVGDITLDLVYAYRHNQEYSFGTDLDLTAAPMVAGGGHNHTDYHSLEARLSNPAQNSDMRWIAGLSYYQHKRSRILHTLQGPGSLNDYNPAPEQSNRQQDLSAFAQLSWPLADKVTLTGGMRFESSEAKLAQQAGELNLGNLVLTYPLLNKNARSDIWLPKLALSYQPDDNSQFYASATRGYLPGGYNLVAADKGDAIASQFGAYDAERLWSYEVGGKLKLLDGELFVSGAVFYIDASSWQEVNILTAPDGTVLSTALINADAAITSQGVELEMQFQVTSRLSLRAGLGLVEAEYDRYNFSDSLSFAGNKVKMIPEHDISLAIEYDWPDNWYWRAEIRSLGETPLNSDNTAIRERVTLLDLAVGYQADNWSLRAFVENAGNRRYAVGQAYQNFLLGGDPLFYSPLANPRVAGLELGIEF